MTDSSNNSNATADNAINYKTSLTAIRKARRFAVQGLYEWLLTGNPSHEIEAHTRAENAMHTVHLGYYHELMRQIPEQADQLVLDISSYIDRSFDRLDTIEKAVLLIGAYELKHSLHIPYKVVLDEAMQLNTHFGATDAHKLINAVLDQYAKVVREAEVNADQAKKSAN